MTTANVQHKATIEYLKASPSLEGKFVMDVGGGDGFAARQFAERGVHEIVANDLLPAEDKLTDLVETSGAETVSAGAQRAKLEELFKRVLTEEDEKKDN